MQARRRPSVLPHQPGRSSVDLNARLLQMLTDGQTSGAARELENCLVSSERMVLAVYALQMP